MDKISPYIKLNKIKLFYSSACSIVSGRERGLAVFGGLYRFRRPLYGQSMEKMREIFPQPPHKARASGKHGLGRGPAFQKRFFLFLFGDGGCVIATGELRQLRTLPRIEILVIPGTIKPGGKETNQNVWFCVALHNLPKLFRTVLFGIRDDDTVGNRVTPSKPPT